MKIALYQPWIYLHGGLEKSLLELVTRSRHEWIVYTGHYEPENTFPEFAALGVRVLHPTSIKRTIGGTLRSAVQVMTQKIPPDDGVDAIVVWCDGIGDLITFRNRRLPIFNICSTPLRAAFDPVYQQLALKGRSASYRLAFLLFKQAFRFVDRMAWRRFDGIVTTSSEVRNRIVDGGLCDDASKMLMAYPGIEWKPELSDVTYEPFVLLPGRIMWTKNIQQGIRAFVAAGLPKPWKLVVAGFVDRKSREYLDQLRAMVPAGVDVEFVTSPSGNELNDLYRRAAFCLFTPLNEDWGIVPLEAMNHGKAVIANASGGPLESIDDGVTGILVKPDDDAGWSSAIARLALDADGNVAMGQRAHEAVKRFGWTEFVQAIDDGLTLWVQGSAATSAAAAEAEPGLVEAIVLGTASDETAAT